MRLSHDVALGVPPPRDSSGLGLDPGAADVAVDVAVVEVAPSVRLVVRVPSPADLDAALAAAGGDPAGALGLLVDAVTAEVTDGGEPLVEPARARVLARPEALAALDAAIAAAVGDVLDTATVDCPECGHAWEAAVDAEAFAWAALDRSARGLLDDVHLLARAYGWAPDTVLALPPAVRRFHLARVS